VSGERSEQDNDYEVSGERSEQDNEISETKPVKSKKVKKVNKSTIASETLIEQPFLTKPAKALKAKTSKIKKDAVTDETNFINEVLQTKPVKAKKVKLVDKLIVSEGVIIEQPLSIIKPKTKRAKKLVPEIAINAGEEKVKTKKPVRNRKE